MPGGLRKRWRFRRRVRALRLQEVVAGGSRAGCALGFFLVHYEAPDFLTLALDGIAAHHPEAAVTVLDNASGPEALAGVRRAAQARRGVTLLRAVPDKPRHTVALQALFAVALREEVGTAVFLDQDALLLDRVDALVDRLGPEVLLVGARDAVRIPRTDGPLTAGWLRSAASCVHPSFLLLRPARVAHALGAWPLAYDARAERSARRGRWEYEPYHALSVRAAGRILFLDTRMSPDLPPLTVYELDGRGFACHAWYSARAAGLSEEDTVDGLPVAWVRARRDAVLAHMRELNRDGPGVVRDPPVGHAPTGRDG